MALLMILQTGEFMVPQTGQYLINWWFNVRSKNTNTECEPVALGIELHQTTPGFNLIAHSSTHNKLSCCDTGTISGNALFVANANDKFRFVNTSQTDFQLVPNDRYSGIIPQLQESTSIIKSSYNSMYELFL